MKKQKRDIKIYIKKDVYKMLETVSSVLGIPISTIARQCVEEDSTLLDLYNLVINNKVDKNA